jgi:hypothetical protein
MQTHCTATGVQTGQNADHSFSRYCNATGQALEWARCSPKSWGNAVEKLRSRQIDLKERAAAVKIAGWTKAVEKLCAKQAALAEQAKLAEPVRAPPTPPA